MDRTLLIMATLAMLGPACLLQANELDPSRTQDGSSVPSGARADDMEDERDDLLLRVNNAMVGRFRMTDPISVLECDPTFDTQATGEILQTRSDDLRYLYDRLNARTVLRLLEWDGVRPMVQRPRSRHFSWWEPDPWIGQPPAIREDRGSGSSPAILALFASPDDDPDIPEPATAAMIGFASLGLMSRRAWRKQASPE